MFTSNRRLRLQTIGVATLATLSAGALLTLPTLPAVQAAPHADISPNIRDYVATRLNDFTSIMHIEQHDDNAGRKINKDFGLIYKLRGDATLQYKEENKLRLDGYLGAGKATLIVNGPTQYVRIAQLGIRSKTDLGNSPGKRKTLLDAGLLSPGYLDYTEAQYLYNRPYSGTQCAVFRISYKDKSLDTSHRIVWIDPKTKIVLKREEYSQTGKLNATYLYLEPRQVGDGVWFPTRIEVMNNENQRAGITSYRDIKVNQGLDDSIFRL